MDSTTVQLIQILEKTVSPGKVASKLIYHDIIQDKIIFLPFVFRLNLYVAQRYNIMSCEQFKLMYLKL